MQRKFWWLAAGIAVIAIAVAVALARGRAPQTAQTPAGLESAPTFQGQQRGQGPRSGQQRRGIPAPTVTVGHLKSMDISTTLSLTASLISLREARVQSKTAGYLEAVTVRPGDAVQTGQIVAVVEHSQLDAQVLQAQQAALAARSAVQSAKAAAVAAQAQVVNAMAARRRTEADLGNARAALDRAKAQLGVAQAVYTRVTTLFRDGYVSQAAVDDARAQLLSAQAGVEAGEAQVGVAQATIEQADAQVRAAQAQEQAAASQVHTQEAQAASLEAALQNARLAQGGATIRAPWSGVVLSRTLDPGAFVSPSGATPIVTIADLDHVAVVVNVSEASMAAVRRGGPAEITVDAYPGRIFKGIVARMAGGVDPDTRTVQVEIDLVNRDHILRPGMYARVQLFGAPRRTSVLPLSALVTVGGDQFVWVVSDGKVSRRAVTIGATTAALVEITSGLGPADLVVFRGTELVREGGPVRAVPAGE